MAEKTVQEIMEDVRRASGAKPEEKKSSSWGSLKSVLKHTLIDFGDDEPEQSETIELPDFPVEELEPINLEGADKPFDEIYNETIYQNASAEPTLHNLEVMLSEPEIATQPSALKKMAVTFAFKARGESIESVLADSERRKESLKNYASALATEAETIRRDNTEKADAIQKEMEAYFEAKQAEITKLSDESANALNDANKFEDRMVRETSRIDDLTKPFRETHSEDVKLGSASGRIALKTNPVSEVPK